MSKAYLIGIVCGIAMGVIFLVIAMKVSKTDGSVRCKFDERQKIVRATGFKFAFFTLLIYDLAYGCLHSATDRRLMDDLTGIFIGCCLSIVVYVFYAVWNEGYFSINENPKRVLVIFAVVAICNTAIGIRNIVHDEVVKDGMLTSECLNLVCGITFIAIFAIIFIKWQVSKREAD
ncbi:hypothetical protein NXH76_16585 [Blautia schinkii]|nr:hypothetical protein [Blautia schinkii]